MKSKSKKISDALLRKSYLHATSEKIVKTEPGFYNPKTWSEAIRMNKNLLTRLRAFSEYLISNLK